VFVHGLEHFFGGGIRAERPEAITAQMGIRPVERISLGRTTVDLTRLRAFLSEPETSSRFSASRYDLFSNNCNHFSDHVARFLLDNRGIPDEIVNLPQRVSATPMGSQIMALWRSAADAMGDPFGNGDGVMGRGGGGDPFAGFTGARASTMPEPSYVTGTAARAAATEVTRAPQSDGRVNASAVLQAPPALVTYSDMAGVAIVPARVRRAEVAARAAGAEPLSPPEGALLDSMTARVAAGSGDWANDATALALRLLRDWPRTDVAFPGALLARLALTFRVDSSSALAGVVLEGLTHSPEGWGAPAANNQALGALVNAAAKHPEWAVQNRAALAGLIARELGSARTDLRSIASALADALARALAPADVSDECVLQLLAAVLSLVHDEADSDAATRRLLAAGCLCLSPDVASLTAELSLDESLKFIEADASRPHALRALAAEVRCLIHLG
jgi:hypothetical protein